MYTKYSNLKKYKKRKRKKNPIQKIRAKKTLSRATALSWRRKISVYDIRGLVCSSVCNERVKSDFKYGSDCWLGAFKVCGANN